MDLRHAALERVRIGRPFVLRTAVPALTEVHGTELVGVSRLGKRIVIALDGGLRIVQGQVECNYCPGWQTGGKLLADRALSRLLRGDWPRTLEEPEERKAARG